MRSIASLLLLALCALALGACGNTVQQKPIPHNILESLIVAPQPVYWLGASFEGMAVTEASHDAGGAYTVQYGDCLVGGQGACQPPLRIVSAPDNSFLPLGAAPRRAGRIRGRPAVLTQQGRAIVIPTGPVVVDVYAIGAGMAAAAARAMVPIDEPAAPGAPLPAALPDTGFAATPRPFQTPAPLRPLSEYQTPGAGPGAP